MMRLALFFITVCAYAQSPALKAIEYMAAMSKDNSFMGSVLVARGGKVLFSNGYGYANLEHGVLNTVETKFRLGSITKQFTAAAILLLEERGKLSVQDPLCRYLDDCPETWKAITLHHLLTHTSGIFNVTNDRDFESTLMLPSRPLRTLGRVRERPLRFVPGEKFEYSNSGYLALAAVIEKASGESWEEFVDRNIFGPLGMRDTGHDDHKPILRNRAAGYMGDASDPHNAPYHDMTIPIGGGDLYSTAADLLIWDQALYGNKLLSGASLGKMFAPEKNNYGYGWYIREDRGRKVISHNGGIHGFLTVILRFPEEQLLSVVLSNNMSRDTQRIGSDLAGIFLGDTVAAPATLQGIPLPIAQYDNYVGRYALGPRTLVIRRQGTQLSARIEGLRDLPIFPESKEKFFYRAVPAELTFEFGPDGKASHVTLHQGGRNTRGERLP